MYRRPFRPVSFEVANTKYDIVYTPTLLFDEDIVGRIVAMSQKVYVQDRVDGVLLGEDYIEDSIWHEITHAILTTMRHPLNKNEKFIKQFAPLLAQIVKTMKFEPEDEEVIDRASF